MASARWTAAAITELRAALLWVLDNRGLDLANRTTAEISDAVERAARDPERYPWVGAIYSALATYPRNTRRVLTRSRRQTIFYLYRPEEDSIEVLSIKGAGQLPPILDNPRE